MRPSNLNGLFHTITIDWASRARSHNKSSRIIKVDHSEVRQVPKQLGFAPTVFIKGFVKIQVVLAEVGKNPCMKRNASSAVEFQCVGRNLHHYVICLGSNHLRQYTLQI